MRRKKYEEKDANIICQMNNSSLTSAVFMKKQMLLNLKKRELFQSI